MNTDHTTGRLTTWAAAMVVARRDFTAILFSRSFFFFLLGPLFPVIVGMAAGSVGHKFEANVAQVRLGVVMSPADAKALLAATALALTSVTFAAVMVLAPPVQSDHVAVGAPD